MSSTQLHTVNALLEQFGNRFGLAECALDEQGSALLAFDDVLVDLLMDEERDELLLLATVGRPAANVDLYGWLLDANLFARGTTFARDPANQSIILRSALPIDRLEIDGFEAALEHFIATAERVRPRLASSETVESAGSQSRPSQQLIEQFLRA